MDYMAAHGLKRARPQELVSGTVRVITARMDYLPRDTAPQWREQEWQRMATPGLATVSVYARGRDYHKVLRSRLQKLADRLREAIGPFGHRAFTDSAPVLEVALDLGYDSPSAFSAMFRRQLGVAPSTYFAK